MTMLCQIMGCSPLSPGANVVSCLFHFPSHPQQQPVDEFSGYHRYCARGKSAFSLTPTTTAVHPRIMGGYCASACKR
eukprot:scaffold20116_cov69-Cyclotella_meneghiniana.AAC.3